MSKVKLYQDLLKDPEISAAWADRDARLLMVAALCALHIRAECKPLKLAVDYMLQEYSVQEIRAALDELDGKVKPDIA